MNKSLFTWLGVPLLSLCVAAPSYAQAEKKQIDAPKRLQHAKSWQSFFALGSKAFKEGDYSTALIHFHKAQQLAGDQFYPNLVYNHAVTLQKLHRYEEATNVFNRLVRSSQSATAEQRQWSELATYNLGLIAREQGKSDVARNHFQSLQQPGSNPRLQTLAERQLQTLSIKTAKNQPIPAKGSVLVSLGMAWDDNASSLADEISNQLSNAEDTYINGLAYGHYYLSGSRNQGTKLYGLAQMRRYQEFESFNSQVSGLGLTQEFTNNGWGLELGGRWLQSQLDGQRLSNQYTLQTRATKPVSSGQWELSHQSSYIDAAQTFDYIEGWQHQLRAARQWRIEQFSITPSISWETNQRDDKKTSEQFFSYSPDILGASLALRWNLDSQWQLYSQADWSHATFSGTNKSRDLGGEEKEQERSYDRTQLMLGTRYRLAPHWYLKAEYSTTESYDNFQLYSYDKNVFSLKLDYGW